jgi:ornithine carbamoyltransferase
MTRLGMDVVLAHPKGYEIMPEVEELARNNAGRSGGAFSVTHDMDEAFDNADVVYPKSWAPFAAMEQRTLLYDQGEADGIKALEKDLLARNADYNAWECTEKRMALTRDGRALYLHCLPADISNVSCVRGEVAASVFDRCRTPLYLQAGYKPYIIAAMIFLARMDRPADMLMELLDRRTPRLG